jgi:hypothetical protein
MGATGYFIAAGLFMIAAAQFSSQTMNAGGRNGGVQGVLAVASVVVALFLLVKGAQLAIQERKKDRP